MACGDGGFPVVAPSCAAQPTGNQRTNSQHHDVELHGQTLWRKGPCVRSRYGGRRLIRAPAYAVKTNATRRRPTLAILRGNRNDDAAVEPRLVLTSPCCRGKAPQRNAPLDTRLCRVPVRQLSLAQDSAPSINLHDWSRPFERSLRWLCCTASHPAPRRQAALADRRALVCGRPIEKPTCYAQPSCSRSSARTSSTCPRASKRRTEVVLLSRPSSEELEEQSSVESLTEFWARLFHAYVHLAFEQQIVDGRLDASVVQERIDAIGRVEFCRDSFGPAAGRVFAANRPTTCRSTSSSRPCFWNCGTSRPIR